MVFVGKIELDINRICGHNAKNLQMQVFHQDAVKLAKLFYIS